METSFDYLLWSAIIMGLTFIIGSVMLIYCLLSNNELVKIICPFVAICEIISIAIMIMTEKLDQSMLIIFALFSICVSLIAATRTIPVSLLIGGLALIYVLICLLPLIRLVA